MTLWTVGIIFWKLLVHDLPWPCTFAKNTRIGPFVRVHTTPAVMFMSSTPDNLYKWNMVSFPLSRSLKIQSMVCRTELTFWMMPLSWWKTNTTCHQIIGHSVAWRVVRLQKRPNHEGKTTDCEYLFL